MPVEGRPGRQTIYDWLERDPTFAEQMRLAHHDYRESLQDIPHERIQNPQGNRGSDGLLSHMLNANWPEKFRADAKPVDEGVAKQTLNAITELARQQLEAQRREASAIEGEAREVIEGNEEAQREA